MKKFYLMAMFLLGLSSTAFAQAITNNGALAGLPTQTNVTVTSSPTVVIPAGGGNLDWSVFDETSGTNMRCTTKIPGISNSPSSTNGFLVVGAGNPLMSYPFTDPNYELDCATATGSASVSVWIDKVK